MSRRNPERNPFYAMVVLTGAVFAVTALAYVVMLVTQQSPPSGAPAPPVESPVFNFLDRHGETLMLCEAGVLAVAAVSAIGLDRWRSSKTE